MDKHLITIRRGEVDREIDKLKLRLHSLTEELRELDIAEKVFDRLSGAKGNSASAGNEPQSAMTPSDEPKARPTVRQMITEALMDARQRGLPGRTPKQIRDYINVMYRVNLGQQINTTASRMWNDLKEIEKDTVSGLFSLPSKEKPADLLSSEEQSAGLSQPARDGEPVQEVEHDNMS